MEQCQHKKIEEKWPSSAKASGGQAGKVSTYNHKIIERKWQERWERLDLYKADDHSKKEKKYILDMFPYPSGEGLHVGHVESYTATDIISRYLRMNDYNVLHPQGWDAFGLPAENYAIKTKVHPAKTTERAIATFKRQMKSLGFSYDWNREVNSSSPDYYKWTQWLFLLFYKNGLAYRKKAKVNWCENCQTVLANEQAEGGKCERCGRKVIQNDLEQWFFKITDFIEDQNYEGRKIRGLINGLDDVDWPESTKLIQKNWIGKSEGVEFVIPIKNSNKVIKVYTTRVDTVFGMTYAIISPENELIYELKDKIKNWDKTKEYIEKSQKKTELERTDLAKEKTGIRLEGILAVNPFNKAEIPVFVADYVLGSYGTGAVMAVPAHDERDYEFASKYNLEIVEVVKSKNGKSTVKKEAFIEDGILINSGEYNGLTSEKAREEIAGWLKRNNLGKEKINYKIRDWLISRQRYWGAPIPIVYCKTCGIVPVPEKDLPVKLPTDVDFMPTGESPLIRSKSFHNVKCPACGGKARRESDTMDTFVCSSWYYMRYADPKNSKEFASRKLIGKWLPVDIYVGGAEHSVLHLLYSRFFTKVLHKYGYVDFNEPFLKMRHQGIILAEDGSKMSKSKGNIINPDDIVYKFGADSLRMYEMFMGPLDATKPWSTKGISGITRFLERVYKSGNKIKTEINENADVLLNKTIKKVTDDIENLKFNTAIAALMILVNGYEKQEEIAPENFGKFLKLLSPFAPHLVEELWEKLGNKKSVFLESWPKYDKKLVKDEEIELVVQVNGKLRDRIKVPVDISQKEAEKLALGSEKVKKFIAGKDIRKVIFVKGKLVNIVI